jgi:hypothetical protein
MHAPFPSLREVLPPYRGKKNGAQVSPRFRVRVMTIGKRCAFIPARGNSGRIHMSLTDLASFGSFVSAVAVVISLIYLALQIRQNTRHSQALIQQGRAARIADTSLKLAELRGDDGINACFDGSPDVSARDVARFLFTTRSILISAEDSFFQAEEGLLSPIAFESVMASIRSGMMRSPGLNAAWRLTRHGYEPQFRDFMDRLQAEEIIAAPHSLADDWRAALVQTARGEPTAP